MVFILSAVPLCSFAQVCTDDWSAELTSADGLIEVRRAAEPDWAPAQRGDIYCIGDSVRVLSYGSGVLIFPDGTPLRFDRGATVVIARPQNQSRTWLELLQGAIYMIVRDPRAITVVSPFANANIEGTEFAVVVTDDSMTVTVFEGTVTLDNAAGTASASSGQSVVARMGQAPVLQAVVRPRDSVTWTLYYSPVLRAPLPAPDEAPSSQQASDPDFFTGRAAALLDVGSIEQAEADLETALMLNPGDANALALQSIIETTQNNQSEALRLADLAVASDPGSAAARVAWSW